MNEKQKKRTGKFISLILRHAPEKIGLQLDNAGWAEVDELLAGLQRKGHGISFEQLQELVATNDKKRYSFNADQTRIRANQGHSLTLDLQLESREPPEQLFHGTATRFLDSIRMQGLVKGSRHHVHLSADVETAHKVGSRHGKPVVLNVDALSMHQAGHIFYCSENGVWLTEHVPPGYLSGLE
ncbi:MAG: RNA 2'-phosphotransferase [Thiolinea sp.]